jgi:hypothetical protein
MITDAANNPGAQTAGAVDGLVMKMIKVKIPLTGGLPRFRTCVWLAKAIEVTESSYSMITGPDQLQALAWYLKLVGATAIVSVCAGSGLNELVVQRVVDAVRAAAGDPPLAWHFSDRQDPADPSFRRSYPSWVEKLPAAEAIARGGSDAAVLVVRPSPGSVGTDIAAAALAAGSKAVLVFGELPNTTLGSPQFVPGDTIVPEGLATSSGYNGCAGTVKRFNRIKGRYVVQVAPPGGLPATLSIQGKHMKLVSPALGPAERPPIVPCNFDRVAAGVPEQWRHGIDTAAYACERGTPRTDLSGPDYAVLRGPEFALTWVGTVTEQEGPITRQFYGFQPAAGPRLPSVALPELSDEAVRMIIATCAMAVSAK